MFCPYLEKVTIYQCGSHACGTEALRGLRKLQFLEIHVQSEDDDWVVVAELKLFCFPEHISTLVLQLQVWPVDLHDLFSSLTVLRSLACLHLCNFGGQIQVSRAFPHLRSLESLHLQGFSFADEWASSFSCLTKLTLLSFAELIDPVPLHELASLPALQTLHLTADLESMCYPIVLDLDVLPDLPPTLCELCVIGLIWLHEMSSLRGLPI